jgi:hypothetical protein
MNMNERVKEHKESIEYKSGLMKFSALIWMIGTCAFALFSLLGALYFWQNPAVRWTSLAFTALFAWQSIVRVNTFILYRNACIGAGLGLNVDSRLLKNIAKKQKKIKKLEYDIEWMKTYISEEAKAKLITNNEKINKLEESGKAKEQLEGMGDEVNEDETNKGTKNSQD